jgi:hypothetical protein
MPVADRWVNKGRLTIRGWRSKLAGRKLTREPYGIFKLGSATDRKMGKSSVNAQRRNCRSAASSWNSPLQRLTAKPAHYSLLVMQHPSAV